MLQVCCLLCCFALILWFPHPSAGDQRHWLNGKKALHWVDDGDDDDFATIASQWSDYGEKLCVGYTKVDYGLTSDTNGKSVQRAECLPKVDGNWTFSGFGETLHGLLQIFNSSSHSLAEFLSHLSKFVWCSPFQSEFAVFYIFDFWIEETETL